MGLCLPGGKGAEGDTERLSGFFAWIVKRAGLCGAGVYDRDTAHKKYGEHSAINIFDEYSMIDPKNLGEYFGFTAAEAERQCKKYDMDMDSIRKWYDGYLLDTLRIYNPKSVSDALMWRDIHSYWTGTETYEALKVYIDINFDGLKEAVVRMLGGGRCKISTRKFQNDMMNFKSKDDVLTLLIHPGYLTYDKKSEEVLIPNQESMLEFLNVVDDPGWSGLIRAPARSGSLLESAWAMNEKEVADGISVIHDETASLLSN